ncbi:hypothetical protein [Pollutibacter soli]|uniref:hypothetical protein n=1 Tax=Pollutibacter soli TaxID=3034157 RepID=UPI003013C7D8
MMIRLFLSFAFFIGCLPALTQENPRQNFWNLSSAGGITWNISQSPQLPHADHIELSGTKVSAIINYEINKNKQLILHRDIIFPQLRTYDRTNGVSWQKFRAYRRLTYGSEIEPTITDSMVTIVFDKVDSVRIDGKLVFYHTPVHEITLTRTLFPSMSGRLFVEKWTLTNNGTISKKLQVGNNATQSTISGYKGIYHNNTYSEAKTEITLAPGITYSFAIYFAAAIDDEPVTGFEFAAVEKERDDFMAFMQNNLVLETNNPVLDQLFYFSKIRAAESIFDSKMGLVHSPGGGNYYVGIWANDQAEYSGPFFPLLGYDKGIIAAKNAYIKFLKHIPKDDKPIQYSFEIEGDVIASNKDRGDAAMIAYGASQYLLRLGDRQLAKEIWPLIEWCLDYCNRKLNSKGVVMSKTDEMEGRIATGDANLATSSLYYGGLTSGAVLASELGLNRLSQTYTARKIALEKNIEAHFGYRIDGYDTYRYFDGNERLRHWISLPLAMGINTRATATADALLEKLWTENGVLVELDPNKKPDQQTFWDRGTLYVLRGVLKAGYLDKSIPKLITFSEKRLLGDHVPYVIEAYPENDMQHLSAESALYCRIFIEGLLGLEQDGFAAFSITPNLNQQLHELKLRNMHVGKDVLSFELRLVEDKIETKIFADGKLIKSGSFKAGTKVKFVIPE